MNYFIYASSFFPKSSLEEMEKTLGKIKILHNFNNIYVVKAKDVDLSKKAKSLKFCYGVFKLYATSKLTKAKYLDQISSTLKKSKFKGPAIKIECFDVNSSIGFSAKDIEVAVGTRMEKAGVDINIEEPKTLLYAVLIDMVCFAGFTEFKPNLFLDPLRHYKKDSAGVSRSERKLAEAFDVFGIASGGLALDLGAAPGGWSTYLAKKNFKVIAIDKGELNYEKIKQLGIKISQTDSATKLDELLAKSQIVHVKSRFEDLKKIPPIDLLVCDMNIGAIATANAVLKFSGNLKEDANAIITIKCMTRNIEKFLAEAIDILKKEFKFESAKVLPNNRQEITLWLRKT